jgi:hypothetical protein
MKGVRRIGVVLIVVVALVGARFLIDVVNHGVSTRRTHSDHLDVQTKDGKSVSIPLTRTTKYLRGNAKATASDPTVGSRVVVHRAAGGSAAEVRLLAAAAAARNR